MDLDTRLLIALCFITTTSLLIHIYHMIRNEHFKVNFCGYLEFENLTPFQQYIPPIPNVDEKQKDIQPAIPNVNEKQKDILVDIPK